MPDERNDYADLVIELLQTSHAVVPAIWRLEVANTLLVAERRKRISQADSDGAVQRLAALPIRSDDRELEVGSEFSLARATGLSAYDASYLFCATRLALPLATIDRQLAKFARGVHVTLLEA